MSEINQIRTGIFIPNNTSEELQEFLKTCSDEVTVSFRSFSPENSYAEMGLFKDCLKLAEERGLTIRDLNYDFIKHGKHVTVLFRAEILTG